MQLILESDKAVATNNNTVLQFDTNFYNEKFNKLKLIYIATGTFTNTSLQQKNINVRVSNFSKQSHTGSFLANFVLKNQNQIVLFDQEATLDILSGTEFRNMKIEFLDMNNEPLNLNVGTTSTSVTTTEDDVYNTAINFAALANYNVNGSAHDFTIVGNVDLNEFNVQFNETGYLDFTDWADNIFLLDDWTISFFMRTSETKKMTLLCAVDDENDGIYVNIFEGNISLNSEISVSTYNDNEWVHLLLTKSSLKINNNETLLFNSYPGTFNALLGARTNSLLDNSVVGMFDFKTYEDIIRPGIFLRNHVGVDTDAVLINQFHQGRFCCYFNNNSSNNTDMSHLYLFTEDVGSMAIPSLTFSFWVNFETIELNQTLVDVSDINDGERIQISKFSDNSLAVLVYNTNNTQILNYRTSFTFSTNQWTHCALFISSANKKIYINGNLETLSYSKGNNGTNFNLTDLTDENLYITFGCRRNNSLNCLQGLVGYFSDFAWYSGELSQAKIQEIVSGKTDFFDGRMKDFAYFDKILTENEILAIMNGENTVITQEEGGSGGPFPNSKLVFAFSEK
jgi:hypothetical protein